MAVFAFWCQNSEPRQYQASSFPARTQDERAGSHSAIPMLPAPSTVTESACPGDKPLLAITCTTNEPLPRLLQWIRYHQLIGFSLFYLFVEGHAMEPAVVEALRALVGVKVFMPDDKLAWWHKHTRAHHEFWLKRFFGQPCNGELFVKQSLNMEVAIHQANVDGVSWIGHIDTDELVYPAGSPSYSMHEVLETVPPEAHALVLPNYEALPEHEHVVDPSVEVSLFKVAVDHIDRASMMANYRTIAHGNPNYFIAYSNGKSLARVQPGLRPHGAHRWASYNGSFESYSHPQAAVLHYTYNRILDLMSRRDRCECAPTETDVKRCFWLSFDQEAFVAAALKTDEQLRVMFRERLVWDNPETIASMRKKGLLDRIYSPQLLIRGVQSDLMHSVAWRPVSSRQQEVAIRAADTQIQKFSYWDGPLPTTCQQFLDTDSSLNILELMGEIPGENDTRDADAVLADRIRQSKELPNRRTGS